ncbi:WEB family protein [Carex littledalei]|uniref:WEB family protein n=1 Tax=Carex littledalei TaxID=544730 RepID=A0A833VUR6_9POAL|nr:WEB family protein [Carex littledalei]
MHKIQATSKVAKLIRGGSTKSSNRDPSPSLHTNGIIGEKGMSTSMDSKISTGERRSIRITPRLSNPASEKSSRPLKLSELQEQVTVAQENLKKAREKLEGIEKEKAGVIEDLKDARRMIEETNEKFEEALSAKRRAEEAWEIEKFRAVELEQSSIDSMQKKEDEWRKKLEITQKQHSQDIAALVLTNKELEKAKSELAKAIDAKCAALNRAEEISKTVEENEKKMETLNEEINRLKGLLATELENKTKEASEIITQLEAEAVEMKAGLEKAKKTEEKLLHMEELVEGLKIDLAYSKRAEVESTQLVEELKRRAEELENRVEELDDCNTMKERSIVSMTKELEENSSILNVKESEICNLKEKVQLLEPELAKYKEDAEKSGFRVDVTQKEVDHLRAKVESLELKIEDLDAAKREAMNKERMASLKISSLLEERNKILKEKEMMKDELDNSKKAMGDLASALREVSSEAREAKERVLIKQAEIESFNSQISEITTFSSNAQQKYESEIEEANKEIARLRKTVDKLEMEAKSSKEEWHFKEIGFKNSTNKSDEQINSIRSEMDKVLQSLKGAEHELQVSREDQAFLHNKLRQVEAMLKESNSTAEKAMTEGLQLNEALSEKEVKLSCAYQEINELRVRETFTMAKIEELTALLGQANARKMEEDDAVRGAENSKIMLIKMEMDKAMESRRVAERDIQVAKDDKSQLENKLRQVESKITEANLTAEEAKIDSLRLKEMLSEKENELKSLARENDNLRQKEVAAQAKIDELSALLAEFTAKKAEETNVRSSEKQPHMLLKLMCSPLEKVREDQAENRLEAPQPIKITRDIHDENKNRQNVNEKAKVVDELESVEGNNNGTSLENHLAKERDHHDATDHETSDDEIDSNPEEIYEQTNGLLANGPDNIHHHKKKKALLRKFGNLLKKKVTASR